MSVKNADYKFEGEIIPLSYIKDKNGNIEIISIQFPDHLLPEDKNKFLTHIYCGKDERKI